MLFSRNNNEFFPNMDLTNIFGIISATTRKFFQINCIPVDLCKICSQPSLLPGPAVVVAYQYAEGQEFEYLQIIMFEKCIK